MIPVAFTPEAKTEIANRIKSAIKSPETVDIDSMISEVFDKVSDRISGEYEPDYEIPGSMTKTGAPYLISVSDDSFVWGE